jgi:hypothetical protein
MATTVRVEAAVIGRRRAGTDEHPLEIDLVPGSITARDLIAAVVRAEVATYEARAEERTFVRVLTERALEDGVASGVVGSGGAEPAQQVDAPAAIDAALLAFEDGLFQLYVDDQPVVALGDEVVFGDRTRLMFLRLVALAGG